MVFDEPGPPEVLQWRDVAPIAPAAHEVLIRVEATGINNADLMKRRGQYPNSAAAPQILGLECAGSVSAVGDDVAGFRVGDRVCALLDGGGYAEEVAVAATQVLAIPTALDAAHASIVPEAACTVYSNLAMIAGLGSGQTVLIHGATGGIGTFAVQWAHAIGATVITTASTDSSAKIGRQLGADTAINYKTEDFVTATLDATDGRGVDAILDVVGADYLDRNLHCLADDGHLVTISGHGGSVPLDLSLLLERRASVSATLLNPRPPEHKAAIVDGVRRDVMPLLESGAIKPLVHAEVPMAEAARGHALLESGSVVGRVVLVNARQS
ncbi:NAD(P)H-quinone oxidoreductase [Mycolicibacterium sp. 018/SC-01/001]|nr:NAD(P)H-quinone oxidoreductase [Mycolicibacterium sp. 018/SC-01/001]